MPKDHVREDELDTGFSDDEYDPRRIRPAQRPASPDRYPPSSSSQPPHPRPHRGGQAHRVPRRQSHDSVPARPHDPNAAANPRNPQPRPAAQERGPARSNHPRGGYGKRRSGESGGNARRGSEYHEPRYENPGNYDSYAASHAEGGDNRVRFFVALFDYDPQTMSPNPDAADEELPFQEGQMIKVIREGRAAILTHGAFFLQTFRWAFLNLLSSLSLPPLRFFGR